MDNYIYVTVKFKVLQKDISELSKMILKWNGIVSHFDTKDK